MRTHDTRFEGYSEGPNQLVSYLCKGQTASIIAKTRFQWGISMRRIAAFAAAIALLATSGMAATAEDLASQIVGVWKLKNIERKELASGKAVKYFGKNPSGYLHFTKGGRWISEGFAEARKVPAAPELSDAERVALFKTMFAYAGTYKLEGDKLILAIDASWNQAWTGTNQVFNKAVLSGTTMFLETAPFKAVLDGADIIVTGTYDRVE